MTILLALKSRLSSLRHALARRGLWPFPRVCQEDLHGGIVEITYSALGVPYHVEKYNLGPNVGCYELDKLMAPLSVNSTEGRHRLRFLADLHHLGLVTRWYL